MRLGLFLLVLMVAPAAAQPAFPELTGRVVDEAEILSSEAEAALTARLASWEERSSDQIVVVTVADLQGYPIEDYGYQLGRAWGIGVEEGEEGRSLDNGALLLVAPNERAVRIEVGYGLEGDLTDALSSNILQRAVLPAFREGAYERGIIEGVEGMIEVLSGNTEAWASRRERAGSRAVADSEGGVPWPLIVFILLFVMPTVLGRGQRRSYRGRRGPWGRHRYRAGDDILPWIIASQLAGGARGGFSYGGGGFSSGGGFGGFSGGGGSFGGGGASGSW